MNDTVKRIAQLVAGGVLVAGCATVAGAATAHQQPTAQHRGTHGAPVFRTAPDKAPAMKVAHHVCTTTDPVSSPSSGVAKQRRGLVWVRPHPASVVTVWVPGLNAKHCLAKRVVGSGSTAVHLARDLERAPKIPAGIYHCPNDDATRVYLYFTYESGRDEYVEVPLAGCRFIGAPHRAGRESTGAINRQLRDVAPRQWTRYLGG